MEHRTHTGNGTQDPDPYLEWNPGSGPTLGMEPRILSWWRKLASYSPDPEYLFERELVPGSLHLHKPDLTTLRVPQGQVRQPRPSDRGRLRETDRKIGEQSGETQQVQNKLGQNKYGNGNVLLRTQLPPYR